MTNTHGTQMQYFNLYKLNLYKLNLYKLNLYKLNITRMSFGLSSSLWLMTYIFYTS